MSPREFFAYHLNIRTTGSDYLFQARTLFQEWFLHVWIVCENQKPAFQRQNQTTLRTHTLQNIQEALPNHRHQDSLYHIENEIAVGRVILASSF